MSGSSICKKEIILLILLLVSVLLLSYLNVFLNSDITRFLLLVIGLFFLFYNKSKYRIYVLIFLLPFSKMMVTFSIHIGSLFTWLSFIYIICLLIPNPKNNIIRIISLRQTKIFLIFSIYTLLLYLFNFRNLNFLKNISFLVYLSLPICFLFDNKGEKNTDKLIFLFALSVILSNLFSFSLIYIFPDLANPFLSLYFPEYIVHLNHTGLQNFRFPGLLGDPNLNSCALLISLSLLMINFLLKPFSFKKPITYFYLFFAILIFDFSIIGQSKTFLIAFSILFLLFLFLLFKQKNFLLQGTFLLMILLATIVPFFLNTSFGYNIISRFLFVDSRAGNFLSNLTTGRSDLFMEYFEVLLKKPLYFLFGQGLKAPWLRNDAHNAYLESIWFFGMIGSIFLFSYFILLSTPRSKYSCLFLIVLFVYSLSLHIATFEMMWSACFIFYLINKEIKDKKNSPEVKVSNFESSFSITRSDFYEI